MTARYIANKTNSISLTNYLFSYKHLAIPLALFLIFSACKFKPDDIEETILEQPSEIAPRINIELSPETDTLRLADQVTIHYKLEASPRKVHWVEFSLDNMLLFRRDYVDDSNLEMDFNPNSYSEGLHHLKIVVFTSSNSGSIADKTQSEGYFYQLEWPVVIDFTPIHYLKILSITKMPGGAMIKWEKFPHAAFENYTLEKNSSFENKTEKVAVIKDPTICEYFDSNYLEGENVYYRIYLNGLAGDGVYYSVMPGPVTATWSSDFSALVKWEPTQNPGRLNYYRLFQNDQISPQDEKHIPYGEKNEIVLDKLPFGKDITLNLQYVPKTTNTNYSFQGLKSASTVIAVGDTIPVHELTKKVSGTNYSLMCNGNKLIRYDHENRQRLDSLDFKYIELRAYRISPDGKTLYTLTGNNLQAWEINDFRNIGKVNLLEVNSKLENLYDISVASDSKILFTLEGENILVYDFNNRQTIIPYGQYKGWSKISPDGKHVLSRFTQDKTYYRYYTIESHTLVLKDEIVYNDLRWGNMFFFSSPDFDQLIIVDNSEIQVRKASDFALLNTLKFSEFQYDDYDPETNQLVYINLRNEGNIIKFPAGETIQTIYLSAGRVIMHRNFLIGRNGRQLKL